MSDGAVDRPELTRSRATTPSEVGSTAPPGTEAPVVTKPDLDEVRDVKPKALRPYKVVVLDCNCHTFDDVEVALCRVIPGMTRSKAHQHAWEIHTTGASVVARAPKERAELYQEQLSARGLRVTIEPD
jgi:ATP-dependent Clp protease adaptor protein ClpS